MASILSFVDGETVKYTVAWESSILVQFKKGQ